MESSATPQHHSAAKRRAPSADRGGEAGFYHRRVSAVRRPHLNGLAEADWYLRALASGPFCFVTANVYPAFFSAAGAMAALLADSPFARAAFIDGLWLPLCGGGRGMAESAVISSSSASSISAAASSSSELFTCAGYRGAASTAVIASATVQGAMVVGSLLRLWALSLERPTQRLALEGLMTKMRRRLARGAERERRRGREREGTRNAAEGGLASSSLGDNGRGENELLPYRARFWRGCLLWCGYYCGAEAASTLTANGQDSESGGARRSSEGGGGGSGRKRKSSRSRSRGGALGDGPAFAVNGSSRGASPAPVAQPLSQATNAAPSASPSPQGYGGAGGYFNSAATSMAQPPTATPSAAASPAATAHRDGGVGEHSGAPSASPAKGGMREPKQHSRKVGFSTTRPNSSSFSAAAQAAQREGFVWRFTRGVKRGVHLVATAPLRPFSLLTFVALAELQWQPSFADVLFGAAVGSAGLLLRDAAQLPLAATMAAVGSAADARALMASASSSSSAFVHSDAPDQTVATLLGAAPFAAFVAVRTFALLAGTHAPWAVAQRRGLVRARGEPLRNSDRLSGGGVGRSRVPNSPPSLLSQIILSPSVLRVVRFVAGAASHPAAHLGLLHFLAAARLTTTTGGDLTSSPISTATAYPQSVAAAAAAVSKSLLLLLASATLRRVVIPFAEQNGRVAFFNTLVYAESVLGHRYTDALRRLRWGDYGALNGTARSVRRGGGGGAGGGLHSASASVFSAGGPLVGGGAVPSPTSANVSRTASHFASHHASVVNTFVSQRSAAAFASADSTASTLVEKIVLRRQRMVAERLLVTQRIALLSRRLDRYKHLSTSMLGLPYAALMAREAAQLEAFGRRANGTNENVAVGGDGGNGVRSGGRSRSVSPPMATAAAVGATSNLYPTHFSQQSLPPSRMGTAVTSQGHSTALLPPPSAVSLITGEAVVALPSSPFSAVRVPPIGINGADRRASVVAIGAGGGMCFTDDTAENADGEEGAVALLSGRRRRATSADPTASSSGDAYFSPTRSRSRHAQQPYSSVHRPALSPRGVNLNNTSHTEHRAAHFEQQQQQQQQFLMLPPQEAEEGAGGAASEEPSVLLHGHEGGGYADNSSFAPSAVSGGGGIPFAATNNNRHRDTPVPAIPTAGIPPIGHPPLSPRQALATPRGHHSRPTSTAAGGASWTPPHHTVNGATPAFQSTSSSSRPYHHQNQTNASASGAFSTGRVRAMDATARPMPFGSGGSSEAGDIDYHAAPLAYQQHPASPHSPDALDSLHHHNHQQQQQQLYPQQFQQHTAVREEDEAPPSQHQHNNNMTNHYGRAAADVNVSLLGGNTNATNVSLGRLDVSQIAPPSEAEEGDISMAQHHFLAATATATGNNSLAMATPNATQPEWSTAAADEQLPPRTSRHHHTAYAANGNGGQDAAPGSRRPHARGASLFDVIDTAAAGSGRGRVQSGQQRGSAAVPADGRRARTESAQQHQRPPSAAPPISSAASSVGYRSAIAGPPRSSRAPTPTNGQVPLPHSRSLASAGAGGSRRMSTTPAAAAAASQPSAAASRQQRTASANANANAAAHSQSRRVTLVDLDGTFHAPRDDRPRTNTRDGGRGMGSSSSESQQQRRSQRGSRGSNSNVSSASASSSRRRSSSSSSSSASSLWTRLCGRPIRAALSATKATVAFLATPPFAHEESPSLFEAVLVTLLCTHSPRRDSFAALIDTPLTIARCRFAASAVLRRGAEEAGLSATAAANGMMSNKARHEVVGEKSAVSLTVYPRGHLPLALLFESEAALGRHLLTRRCLPRTPLYPAHGNVAIREASRLSGKARKSASQSALRGGGASSASPAGGAAVSSPSPSPSPANNNCPPTKSLARWLLGGRSATAASSLSPAAIATQQHKAPSSADRGTSALRDELFAPPPPPFTVTPANLRYISNHPRRFLAMAADDDAAALLECAAVSPEEAAEEAEGADAALVAFMFGREVTRTSVVVAEARPPHLHASPAFASPAGGSADVDVGVDEEAALAVTVSPMTTARTFDVTPATTARTHHTAMATARTIADGDDGAASSWPSAPQSATVTPRATTAIGGVDVEEGAVSAAQTVAAPHRRSGGDAFSSPDAERGAADAEAMPRPRAEGGVNASLNFDDCATTEESAVVEPLSPRGRRAAAIARLTVRGDGDDGEEEAKGARRRVRGRNGRLLDHLAVHSSSSDDDGDAAATRAEPPANDGSRTHRAAVVAVEEASRYADADRVIQIIRDLASKGGPSTGEEDGAAAAGMPPLTANSNTTEASSQQQHHGPPSHHAGPTVSAATAAAAAAATAYDAQCEQLSRMAYSLEEALGRLRSDERRLRGRVDFYGAVAGGLSRRLVVRTVWFQSVAATAADAFVRFPLETLAMLLEARALHHCLCFVLVPGSHLPLATVGGATHTSSDSNTNTSVGWAGVVASFISFVRDEASVLVTVLRGWGEGAFGSTIQQSGGSGEFLSSADVYDGSSSAISSSLHSPLIPAPLRGSAWGGVYLDARARAVCLTPLYCGALPYMLLVSSGRLFGTWGDTAY